MLLYGLSLINWGWLSRVSNKVCFWVCSSLLAICRNWRLCLWCTFDRGFFPRLCWFCLNGKSLGGIHFLFGLLSSLQSLSFFWSVIFWTSCLLLTFNLWRFFFCLLSYFWLRFSFFSWLFFDLLLWWTYVFFFLWFLLLWIGIFCFFFLHD